MAMKSCEGTTHALLPPIRMSALVAAMKRGSWYTFEAVDLLDVEDVERLEHRYRSVLFVIVARDALGEDDLGPLLALLRARLHVEGLLEGEPLMGGISEGAGGSP